MLTANVMTKQRKIFTLFFSFFLTLSANLLFAESRIHLEIQTPQEKYKFTSLVHLEKYKNLGELTIALLTDFKIPHTGTSYGLVSLYNIQQDIEVISDTEMKAYGWCYLVNEVLSEKMLNEVLIDSLPHNSELNIKWYYGYAHYKNGEWISQCTQ